MQTSQTSRCPKCDSSWDEESQGFAFCPDCSFPLRLIKQTYKLVQELAEGGFGIVYLASNVSTDKLCVVKIIRPEVFDLPGMKTRFKREIRVTKEIAKESPHIIEIFDHGFEEGLGHFYVMEYLDGHDLSDRLTQSQELTFAQILHIFRQVCAAVSVAHKHKVIHRDLKPDNIFLITRDGDPLFVKVLDFGIAKPLEGTVNVGLTKGAIGTPQYMSPEQIQNSTIGPSSDIYSMGVILYEMLTRTYPFQDSSMTSLLFKHLMEEPQSIELRCPDKRFPDGLNDVVQKALAKKPDKRYATILNFWECLEPFTEEGKTPPSNPRTTATEVFDTQSLLSDDALISTEAFSPTLDMTQIPREPSPSPPKATSLQQPVQKPFFGQRAPLITAVVLALVLLWYWQRERTLPGKISTLSRKPSHITRPGPKTRKRRAVVFTPTAKQAKRTKSESDESGTEKALPKETPSRRRKLRVRRRRKLRKRTRRKRKSKSRIRTKQTPLPGVGQSAKKWSVARKKCGQSGPRTRWIWSTWQADKRLKISFPNCSSCQADKKRGGYCLRINTRNTQRVRIKLMANGYQKCVTLIPRSALHLRIKLNKLDPNALGDDNYKCLKTIK